MGDDELVIGAIVKSISPIPAVTPQCEVEGKACDWSS